ncbi:hypothetical protein HU200_005774 [Digitaria exilis]|uniref:F-box protein AT5G49610-like beta-propeller domain-containing protein n=1 Tax=Digitaria exilis TaxID=1010633 RepID=A0A835FQ55_9POAL|nr:hypothetical protein HU200_005774 [Digitaria exilis]
MFSRLELNGLHLQFRVWEPVTGDLSRVAFPPEFQFGNVGNMLVFQDAAVLRAPGVVHADEDNSIPFLVALVGSDLASIRTCACVYSSETGVWSNLISTACPDFPIYTPTTLVGSSLYWLLGPEMAILEFDLDKQVLAVIDVPLSNCPYRPYHQWILPAEGGLSFLRLSGYSAELWMRKMDSDGIAGWVLGRTIELDKLLSLNSEEGFPIEIIGIAEDDNMIILLSSVSVFMVQLHSGLVKKAFRLANLDYNHPFASVYTAGWCC